LCAEVLDARMLTLDGQILPSVRIGVAPMQFYGIHPKGCFFNF